MKALLIIFCFVISGCRSNGPATKRLTESLSALDLKNPENDARKSLNNGDDRFAALLGEAPGPYFPGVLHEKWPEIRKNRDFWMILGTSDAIESEYHSDLIERAEKYSIRFNTAILDRSKDSHITPAPRSD